MRQAVTLLVAVLLGGLVAYAVGSSCNIAAAQTVPPSSEVLNERQVREFRSWLDKTKSSDSVTKNRWQRIFTRSARSKLPTLSRTLVTKGGLGGAAAGIWIHNGVTLYHGLECGETSCPQPFSLDVEFRKAEIEAESYGGSGGFFRVFNNDGSVAGSGAITSAKYNYVAGGSTTVRIEYAAKSNLSNKAAGAAGIDFASGSPSVSQTVTFDRQTYADPVPSFGQNPLASSGSVAGGDGTAKFQFFTKDVANTSQPRQKYGPAFPVNKSFTFENPVFDWGESSVRDAPTAPGYTPPAGDYVGSPEDTKKLYDGIKADPEYSPPADDLIDTPTEDWEKQHERRIGELTPTHGPEEWTRTNPDGSRTTRFRDGTELTTWPDGTEQIKRGDGTESWTYPDGTTREISADGTETTTYPDGTSKRVSPDGTETTTWPDGTKRTRRENQPDQWTNPDGTTRTTPTPQEQTENYPEPSAKPNPGPGGGGGGTTNQGPDGCASPRVMTFELPEIPLQDHFPFSLILKAWDWMSMLVSTPRAPSFNLPLFGTISPPPVVDSLASSVRAVIGVVVAIGMSFWFYRYITGKGSDG